MAEPPGVNLWPNQAYALDYLRRVDTIPHRVEGEAALLELLPAGAARILDLGTGAGRLVTLGEQVRPRARFVALDFSPTMIEAAQSSFDGDENVTVVQHDLDESLPPMSAFDAVISSFAIHHVVHERKRTLYQEIFEILGPASGSCRSTSAALKLTRRSSHARAGMVI